MKTIIRSSLPLIAKNLNTIVNIERQDIKANINMITLFRDIVDYILSSQTLLRQFILQSKKEKKQVLLNNYWYCFSEISDRRKILSIEKY